MRLTSQLWARTLAAAPALSKVVDPVAAAAAASDSTNIKRVVGRPPKPRDDPVERDSKRVNIVNPQLCAQAIDLISSDLPPPQTCDIIDYNPGKSTWSQSLHHALQPRRHIFVESAPKVYAPVMDPLLEEKPAVYKLATSLQEVFDTPMGLLSPDVTHRHHTQQNSLEKISPRKTTNPNLIMTANLARRFIHMGSFAGPYSKLFFNAFYRSICGDDSYIPFHKYGLIKLLAWIPESQKTSMFPRSAKLRNRLSRAVEASCDIREIVSSYHNDDLHWHYAPWHGTSVESIDDAAQRQRSAGIETPPDRLQPAPQPPYMFIDPVPQNFDELSRLRIKPPLVSEYIQTWRQLEEEDPVWLEEYIKRLAQEDFSTRRDANVDRNDRRQDHRTLQLLQNRMRTKYNRYNKVDSLARDQILLERQLLALRQEKPNDMALYEKRLERLLRQFDEIKAEQKTFFKDDRSSFRKALDDYRMLTHGITCWHARPFEPLLCRPKEDFEPHQPLSLVELTPKLSFVETMSVGDRQKCFDYINNDIGTGLNMTVAQLIMRILGSDEDDNYVDFLRMLPRLTDPLYGGHYDLNNLRARTLKVDSIIDIAVAYDAWPYRKKVRDMIVSTTSGWLKDKRED